MLNKSVFEKIIQHFQFYLKIDLCASRLNKQLPVSVSYRPDPEATYVNTFGFEWKIGFYAFPPFSLIGRITQKISTEASTGISIVLNWPTQPWYSHLQKIYSFTQPWQFTLFEKVRSPCLSSVQQKYLNSKISEQSVDIFTKGYKPLTTI